MAGVLTANLVLQKTKLDNLKHVRKLNVCGVHVHDVRVLRDAKNVEVLALSVNEIEDLEPLSSCTNLRELYLRKNQIHDVQQVLHLSKLPYLSCLTMLDNPVAQDPNYRRFCIAALPYLVRFDDVDITGIERRDAEAVFPGLPDVEPPAPLFVAPTTISNPLSSTPPRASSGALGLTPRGRPSSNISYDDDSVAQLPAGTGRRSTASENARLAKRLEDLSTQFDEIPVGRSGVAASSAVRSQGYRQVPTTPPSHDDPANAMRATFQQQQQVSSAPRQQAPPLHQPQGPREEGIVLAIKTLLCELSPAGQMEIRRYLDTLRD